MTWLLSRRGLWRILLGIVVVSGLLGLAIFVRSFYPPSGRPTAITGTAPVSLEAASPTAEQLRASLKDANVVIVITDAARADHTGTYGYPRDTTPNIDRIATESLVFEQHFSQFPHTRSSTASLFSGQYPDTHDVHAMDGSLPETNTLGQILGSAGFDTGFFSGWLVASPSMGVGRDFEFASAPSRELRRQPGEAASHREPGEVLRNLSEWLDGRSSGPFLAYVHLLEPHPPYEPPDDLVALFRSKPPYLWRGRLPYGEIKHVIKQDKSLGELANLYDANYRYADGVVGQLVELLKEKNLLDDTLLIVTSDHGQAFGEHGYEGHREGVYDEHLHIPMLMRFPGAGAPVGRVRALTETVDIFPTILDLLGLTAPESVQGESLVPLITGASPAVHDFVFARAEGAPRSYLIRNQNWAMILFRGGKLRALYDLEADPWQVRNVIDDRPEVAERMIAAFRTFAESQRHPPLDFVDPEWRPGRQTATPQTQALDLTDEARRELEALGYLH
ncbi:MAG: sulfatase [Armatimonadetes bacterium]|nr:sulfatase [Armatimonadota bacterium]